MSSSDRVNKIADLLLSHSLGEDDRVDEAKVTKILDDLRQNPPPQHIEILNVSLSLSDVMYPLIKARSILWVGTV